MERANTPDVADLEAPQLRVSTLMVPAEFSAGRSVALRRTSLENGSKSGWNNPDGITVIGVNPLLARARDWDYTGEQLHIEAEEFANTDLSFVSIHHPHCATLDDCAAMTVDALHGIKDRVPDGHRIFLLEPSKGGLDGSRAAHAVRGLGLLDGQVSFGTPYTSEALIPEMLLSFGQEIRGTVEGLKGPEGRQFARFLGSTSMYSGYLFARHRRSFRAMIHDLMENTSPDDLIAASRPSEVLDHHAPQQPDKGAPIPSYVFHYDEDAVVNAERNQLLLRNREFIGPMATISGIHLTLLTDRNSRRTALNCIVNLPKPANPPQTEPYPRPIQAAA